MINDNKKHRENRRYQKLKERFDKISYTDDPLFNKYKTDTDSKIRSADKLGDIFNRIKSRKKERRCF